MKIDANELSHLAAASADAGPPRMDMYSPIHKALRAQMADTLLAVGRMDTDDAVEVAAVAHRVLELMDFCRSHLAHENAFVHAAIEARAPGGSARIAHEHDEHLRATADIAEAATALMATAGPVCDQAALALYRELSQFVADNFQHMLVEETAHNAVLWSRYTDAELLDIHNALVASIPPDEMMVVLRWMVPFMNPAERLAMLSDLQAHAPAPAFQAALDTVRPHLTEREWAKLARGLGLAAVPGLVAA